jgi:hypothetical protein
MIATQKSNKQRRTEPAHPSLAGHDPIPIESDQCPALFVRRIDRTKNRYPSLLILP